MPLKNHSEFVGQLRRSQVHFAISEKFNPLVGELENYEDGEAIQRFKETVKANITQQ